MTTCIACRQSFGDSEEQKAHFVTDWHRYNLRRKAAGLAPVTLDNFNLRSAAAEAEREAAAAEFTQTCEACGGKRFNSEGSWEQHLSTKKHAKNLLKQGKAKGKRKSNKNQGKASGRTGSTGTQGRSRAAGGEAAAAAASSTATATVAEATPSASGGGEGTSSGEAGRKPAFFEVVARIDDEAGELTEDELAALQADLLNFELLEPTDCIFCTETFESFDEAYDHMTGVHSLFVPDQEFLVDLEGLIQYLGEKASVAHLCLYCGPTGRKFHSLEAVRGHMVDKSHCKIDWENGGEEYTDFYDFSTSYPTDGEDAGAAVVNEDGDLVLPGGRGTVVQRSMAIYHRQHHAPEDMRDSARIARLQAEYRALGWRTSTTPGAIRAYEARKEWKVKAKANFKRQRHRNNFVLKLGIQNNNQERFRNKGTDVNAR